MTAQIMPTEIINILMQLPVVLVFIYYFDKRERQTQDFLDRKDKQFLDFLREERAERGKQFERVMNGQDAIVAELSILSKHLDEHDATMTTAISVMSDRTSRSAVEEKTQPRRQNQSQARGGNVNR